VHEHARGTLVVVLEVVHRDFLTNLRKRLAGDDALQYAVSHCLQVSMEVEECLLGRCGSVMAFEDDLHIRQVCQCS
jgi:hypothetical protein